MDFEFRVNRIEPSGNTIGHIHVWMRCATHSIIDTHLVPCEVDAYPLPRGSEVELVWWASEQLAQQSCVPQHAIFEAMCRNRDIQREFGLPQPDSLSAQCDVRTNRFHVRLRLTDGRSLGVSLDGEMLYRARPEEVNRQLSRDLSHQCGIDHQIIFDALQRLVRWDNSVDIPATWRYDDREPIIWLHPIDNETQRAYREFTTYLTCLLERITFSADAMREFQRAIEEYTVGYSKPDLHKKEADERARQLLLDHLSEEQKKTFEKDGWFECVGNKTGKTYRIHNYRNINTVQGKTKYCLVQKDTVPLPDQLLTEKMLIENDEDKFLKVANRFDTESGYIVPPALRTAVFFNQ